MTPLSAFDRWLTDDSRSAFPFPADEVDAGEQPPEDAAEMERLANRDDQRQGEQ